MSSPGSNPPPPAVRGWRRASEAALVAPLAVLMLLAGANWLVVLRAEAHMRAAAREAMIAMERDEIGAEAAARRISVALGDPDRRTYVVAIIDGAHRRIEITAPRSAAGVLGPFGLQAFGDMKVQVFGEDEEAGDPLGRVTRREAEALRAPAPVPPAPAPPAD